MRAEINNSLSTIENTCGQCPKRMSCVFGKPALKTLNTMSTDVEKAVAISYIWDKRTELVVNGCPKTKTVAESVDTLRKS